MFRDFVCFKKSQESYFVEFEFDNYSHLFRIRCWKETSRFRWPKEKHWKITSFFNFEISSFIPREKKITSNLATIPFHLKFNKEGTSKISFKGRRSRSRHSETEEIIFPAVFVNPRDLIHRVPYKLQFTIDERFTRLLVIS